MVKKVIYCGECEKFLYEDIDGFGVCDKTNEECRCSDKCHLINKCLGSKNTTKTN